MNKLVCKCHNRSFKTEKQIKHHVYDFKRKIKKSCPICGIEQSSEYSLLRHLETFKNRPHPPLAVIPKNLVCPCHNKKWLSEKQFKGHIHNFKTSPKVKCPICDFVFSKKALKKHLNDFLNREHPKKVTLFGKAKICCVCKEEKLLEEFYPSKTSQDGIAFRCKECDSLYKQKWHQENKEKVHKRHKEYRQTPQGRLVTKVQTNNRRIGLEKSSSLTLFKIQQVYGRNWSKYGKFKDTYIAVCDLCFEPIKIGEDSLEHFIPVSRNKEFSELDLNGLGNLGIAHDCRKSKEKCNLRKLSMTLEEWFQKYPEYLIRGVNLGYIRLKK